MKDALDQKIPYKIYLSESEMQRPGIMCVRI